MSAWGKRLALLAAITVAGVMIYLALREQPVLVDTATIIEDSMAVTIDEEGETRVREIYTISTPIAGHLDRTALEEGEPVAANKTVIASIHPLDPPFLDQRTKTELQAAVEAAKAAIALAEVEETQAVMALELARSEQSRAARLMTSNVISQSRMESINSNLKLKEAQVESARAMVSLREAELRSVNAKLTQPSDIDLSPGNIECCVELTAPVNGIILKVLTKSEQAVTPGTRIAEIGDPQDLEVVVDVLSTDAPNIGIGSLVKILDWGGEAELTGKVRQINPAAFTKVSSLGIEEQRVNVEIDLDTVPNGLGHGYRVLAKIEIWSAENVLKVPIGALFRTQGEWAVYELDENRARLRQIRIGQMNDRFAQVLEGLKSGQTIILFPNDVLEDGKLAQPR